MGQACWPGLKKGSFGLGMDDHAVGVTLTPIQRAYMEIEKDKGKRPISDSQLGKSGEDTSGTVIEIFAKEGNQRMGQCLPK